MLSPASAASRSSTAICSSEGPLLSRLAACAGRTENALRASAMSAAPLQTPAESYTNAPLGRLRRALILVYLRDRLRMGEIEPLREIDPDALELIEHRLRLHALGHRRDAERAADAADGLDHAAVDRILGDVADELAVDLEEVHRQRLQIKERGH